MRFLHNYYLNSFFWNTFQKILAAIVGFMTVPLLLGYYGKEQYGILSLATACNGYMHLLDMGMNVGAVRYFSLWRSEGDNERINRVARTNITFYGIIAIINMFLLLVLGLYGESLFSVSHEQFLQLRMCLFVLAVFCILNWSATTFSQLLIADKQISYTAKVQSILTILKLALIWIALYYHLSLSTYFTLFTVVISLALFPYVRKCLKDNLINSIKPATFWKDFKVVIMFSLSIFALSLFQMTSTQTRPIILGMFAENGALVNTEFRIIEVIPQFIIMISGTLASIFLPKTTELLVQRNQEVISCFAYKWTILTTIIGNVLCFPFIVGARDVISAYVGVEYDYLYIWLVIWAFTTLLQTYSSPTYSLIMASGKTKKLVCISAVTSIFSLIVNAVLAKYLGIGSAVIGYFFYIILTMLGYYVFYYKSVLKLKKMEVFLSFIKPTSCAIVSSIIVILLTANSPSFFFIGTERWDYIVAFILRAVLWGGIYFLFLFSFKIVFLRKKCICTKYDI